MSNGKFVVTPQDRERLFSQFRRSMELADEGQSDPQKVSRALQALIMDDTIIIRSKAELPVASLELPREVEREMQRQLQRRMATFIVRRVRVNRARTPMEALKATGYDLALSQSDREFVPSIPRGDGDEVTMVFFRLSRPAVEGGEISMEYDALALRPDPYAQLAVNEADREFAHTHTNMVYWRALDKDCSGNIRPVVFQIQSYDWRPLDTVITSKVISRVKGAGSLFGGPQWFGGVPA